MVFSERFGYDHLQVDQKIATELTGVIVVRGLEWPSAVFLKDYFVAILRSSRDRDVEGAINCLYGDVRTQDGLADGDWEISDDVLVLAPEERVLVHFQSQEQITWGRCVAVGSVT